MMGFAGSSYALFAVVWSLMCMVSGALVTDTMLRNTPHPPLVEADHPGDVPEA